MKPNPPGPPRVKAIVREGVAYGLVAVGVWLGWEIIKAPLASRGAPAIAIRVAPTSPEVLRRAAEVELQAERYENAKALSEEALVRGPFNARALRVRGLAEAELGSDALADEMLTLAGNWSLRDDPAHAWLIQHRLQRGDYSSSFAHADTLARRRSDLYPSLFNLFSTAAAADPRAFSVVAQLVGANPPWRQAYLDFLLASETGAPVLGGLALALEKTRHPLTTIELQQLYTTWVGERRFAGIRYLRTGLRRPPLTTTVQNGDFEGDIEGQVYPFGWRLGTGAGINTTVAEDDLAPDNLAFRLGYDGFSSGGLFLQQLVLLSPGDYLFDGRWRSEAAQDDMRVKWELTCAETASPIGADITFLDVERTDWSTFSGRISVPRENCSAQWLRLTAAPGDRRTTIAAWFDKLRIEPLSSHPLSTAGAVRQIP